MWDAETGAAEQTLRLGGQAHNSTVVGLLVSGQRMVSCSWDNMVRVWSLETWACVQTVGASQTGSNQHIYRLAVSGSTLVGGSISIISTAPEEHEVRVWDLETLEPLHTLRQPAGKEVHSLAGEGGEVWGAVGADVVVWGRRG